MSRIAVMLEYEPFLSFRLKEELLQTLMKISQTTIAAYVTHRHPLSPAVSIRRSKYTFTSVSRSDANTA